LDGLDIYEFADGQIEKKFPNGTTEIIFPDKTVRYVFDNGEVRVARVNNCTQWSLFSLLF
jgi:hypothetical protein